MGYLTTQEIQEIQEIQEKISSRKRQIIKHSRNLDQMKEQEACFGSYTPPYIKIEIENYVNKITDLGDEISDLQKKLNYKKGTRFFRNPTSQIGCALLIISALFIIWLISYFSFNQPVKKPPLGQNSNTLESNQFQKATIMNTGGIGVRYRSEPRIDSPSDNGPNEGEIVYLIESIINTNGESWWKVRFPDGRIGYILERHLVRKATIVNTGGIGVQYRSEPRIDSPSDNGPNESETVYLIGSIISTNGESWWKVRFPDDRIGYILEKYLQIN